MEDQRRRWGGRCRQLEISHTQLTGEGVGIQRQTLSKLQTIGETGGERVQVIIDASNTQCQVIGDVGGGKVQAIRDTINTMLNDLRRGASN